MVQNGMTITAEPSTDDTKRIWVKVSMVDYEGVQNDDITVSDANGWTATMDISKFSGHQIVLMLKAENDFATRTSYQYISVIVPDAENEVVFDILCDRTATDSTIAVKATVSKGDNLCAKMSLLFER